MSCGCGGSSSSTGPLLSGTLSGQYGADAGGVESVLATSGSGDGIAAASVAASPGALFTSRGFWIGALFIGIAALVVHGALRKSE